MNRKEFLQTSASLIPMSLLGTSAAQAATSAAPMAAPVSYLESEAYQKNAGKLKFKANGKFKIVQFTDVHWKPGNPASEAAAERMNEVLEAEKPDFVVYTGDVPLPSRLATMMTSKT